MAKHILINDKTMTVKAALKATLKPKEKEMIENYRLAGYTIIPCLVKELNPKKKPVYTIDNIRAALVGDEEMLDYYNHQLAETTALTAFSRLKSKYPQALELINEYLNL